MNEAKDTEAIDHLIELSYESIEELRIQLKRKCYQVDDTVKATKAIARLTEDIRKLLRMRAKLQKEGEKT